MRTSILRTLRSRLLLLFAVLAVGPLATVGILDYLRSERLVDGWITLRVLGSAHTNPIFVIMGGRPIRASRKSADWCLRAVDQCWSSKMRQIRRPERDAVQAAYDHARTRCRQILGESDVG
ncbi:MAG TPA: hypothetical protein VNS10_18375 [Gemmatimonadaceae bacterium]|nr:hypothetical protein [Gemmatimonadaceae bacterium]